MKTFTLMSTPDLHLTLHAYENLFREKVNRMTLVDPTSKVEKRILEGQIKRLLELITAIQYEQMNG
jgi:hypothetical protein